MGYHAFEQKCFNKLVEKDISDNFYIEVKPMRWSCSPLTAISHTRKEKVRSLGVTLTDHGLPPPSKPRQPKARQLKNDAATSAIEEPLYVVWRLQTKENLANLVSSGVMMPTVHKDGFDMAAAFQPFAKFPVPGEWKLDYV